MHALHVRSSARKTACTTASVHPRARKLKGSDGKYHLFASQFVQNCTLKGFNPASTVVRAVADKPEGPFVFAETVFGTFLPQLI